MAEFSTALFEADGTLRSKFSREGVATWGSEVNEGELLYLQSIRVDQEYRGRGIGTKVLETIWQIPEVAVSLFPRFISLKVTLLASRNQGAPSSSPGLFASLTAPASAPRPNGRPISTES